MFNRFIKCLARRCAIFLRNHANQTNANLRNPPFIFEPLETRLLLSGTIYVVDSLQDTNAYDGRVTLREAIRAANSNTQGYDAPAGSSSLTDIITFDHDALTLQAGLPTGSPITLTLNGAELAITESLNIRGPGAESLTLDANQLSRVFNITNASTEVAISGLTLTQGANPTGDGGAINIDRATLNLANVQFSHNTADTGGAIANHRGTLQLTNTIFTLNTADTGGAIWNRGAATLNNTTLAGNTATTAAGGIYFANPGSLTLNNTLVTFNEAPVDPDIQGAYSANTSLVGIDPLFTRNPSPGLDNTWGTADDDPGDLRPQFPLNSPARDTGNNALLPADTLDLDNDNDTAELLPLDITHNPRVFNNTVDIGAYEINASIYTVNSLLDIVADDGLITLREAIEAANTNTAVTADVLAGHENTTDYIIFDPALTAAGPAVIERTGASLQLSGDLTILGPGADQLIIDAKQIGRVISVTDPNAVVRLQGLTLTGGADGGVYNIGDLRLEDVKITQNLNAVVGGGVYNNGGNLTLLNSDISSNTANDDGGAIYNTSGGLTVSRSQLVDNTLVDAYGEGGGIYNDSGTVVVSDTLISGNTPQSVGPYLNNGGGLYNESGDVTILRSTVSMHIAKGGGGVYNRSGQIRVIESSIEANSSAGITFSYGGGLYNYSGDVAFVNSQVIGNFATVHGGGVYTYQGTLSFVQSTVVGNHADLIGGGIYSFEGPVSVHNSIVSLNQAPTSNDIAGNLPTFGSLIGHNPGFVRNPTLGADGIWGTADDDLGDLRLADTSFAINWGDNALAVDADGAPLPNDYDGNSRIADGRVDIGAFEFQGAPSPLIENTSTIITTLADVTDPTDHQISLREAVFYAERTGLPVGFDANLPGSTFILTGGELAVTGPLTIDATAIGGTTLDANQDGRIMTLTSEAVVTLTGLTLTGGDTPGYNNLKDSNGGAIMTEAGSALTLIDVTVTNNKSTHGGGVYSDGALVIQNSVFQNNYAVNHGGGLLSSGTATITDSTFEGNRTQKYHGGAIQTYGDMTLTNSSIINNTATHGGGIYNHDGKLTLAQIVVSHNHALDSGGGVYNLGGILTLIDSTIGHNTATGAGGGLYLENGDAKLQDSAVVNNVADDKGGGIFNGMNNDALLLGGHISGNAAAYGGGLYNDRDAILKVVQSSVNNNTALSGAGVAVHGYGLAIFHQASIHRNVAQYRGGGFNIDSRGRLDIFNSMVRDNAARQGGGLYNYVSGITDLRFSTLISNSATEDGGGAYNESSGALTFVSAIVTQNRAPVNPDVRGYGRNVTSLVSTDPRFVRDPSAGLDGAWGTTDDDPGDLRLRNYSPAINNATVGNIPPDLYDVDHDSDTREIYPFDFAGNPRIREGVPDIGAHEYIPIITGQIDVNHPGEFFTIHEHAFDPLLPGQTQTVTLNLINEGNSTLNVSQMLGLTHPFTTSPINTPSDTDNWTLQPEESFPFTLTFSPTDYGSIDDTLYIYTDDPYQPIYTIDLSGYLIPPPTRHVVNSLLDTIADDNQLTLREAIEAAKEFAYAPPPPGVILEPNIIAFHPDLFNAGPATISLSDTYQLEITDSLILQGPGANLLTIDGSQRPGRIFHINAPDQTVEISGLTISGGDVSSGSKGGGIYLTQGSLLLQNAVLANNRAYYAGGGLYTESDTIATISQSVFVGNYAIYGPGGIYNRGQMDIRQSTIAGNSTTGANPGEISGVYSSIGLLEIYNSIITHNFGDSSRDIHGNYTAHNSLISVNPAFVRNPTPEGDLGDLRLTNASLTLNTGDNNTALDVHGQALTTDLDGAARLHGAAVDIGAYEFQGDPSPLFETPSTVITTTEDIFSAIDGQTSLREAIYYSALTQGVITFDSALTNPVFKLNGQQLNVLDTLQIDASPVGHATIDAQSLSRVLYIYNDVNVTFTNLTITGGRAFTRAGGVINLGQLTLIDSNVTHNITDYSGGNYPPVGGGILNSGQLTLIRADISYNKTLSHGDGGGIYNSSQGQTLIIDSTITHNASRYGGGIHNRGQLEAINTHITSNKAYYQGGGLDLESSSSTILTNTVITANTAERGGAIATTGALTLNHSTVTANHAANSYSSSAGGGIFLPTTLENQVILNNSILALNTADNGPNFTNPFTNNHSLITTDPLFARNPAPGPDDRWATLDDDPGDLRLRLGSPAIDLGNNALLPADEFDLDNDRDKGEPLPLDLSGGSRLVDTTVDAGAYEYQGPITAVHYIVDSLLDIVATDGVITLREAIQAANGGITTDDVPPGSYIETDTITFHPDLFASGPATITLGGTELTITDSLIIQGPGANLLTIDANKLSRVFSIPGDNSAIQIDNLTIAGGATPAPSYFRFGGAIFLKSSQLTLNNTTFSHNSAADGGAIYNDAGQVTLTHTTFSFNSARKGSAIFNDTGQVTITNTNIWANTARDGAIYNDTGSLTLTHCTLSNNLTSENVSSGVGNNSRTNRGDIINGGTAIITHSTIAATTNIGSVANGGSLILNNTIITNNLSIANPTAYNNTSAIIGTFTNNHSHIGLDPTFVQNPSPGPDNLWATDDDLPGDLRLTATSLPLNLGDNTLALHPNGDPLTTDLDGAPRIAHTFVDIGAYEFQSAPSALFETPSTHVNTLDDTTSTTDNLTSLREAIFYNPILNAPITFDPQFANQTLNLNRQLNILNSLDIDASPIDHLTLTPAPQNRILYIGGRDTNVTLTNLTLTGANTTIKGGAIFTIGDTLTINNSTITNNTALSAPAIYNSSNLLTINNSNITHNTASRGVGAIYISSSQATINNSTITNNTAHVGGAIYNAYSTLTINHSTLSHNSATLTTGNGNGGAIYNSQSSLTINNSTITSNTARLHGGAIFTYSDPFTYSGPITITHSQISHNTATEGNGGGIYNGGSDITIVQSTIAYNAATSYFNDPGNGGGIYNDYGTLNITNSAIHANAAHNAGGGIYNDKAKYGSINQNLILTNSTLTNNSAYFGAGLYNDASGLFKIQNATITANRTFTANASGGIHNENTTPRLPLIINNSIVALNNTSPDIITPPDTITINHSLIATDPLFVRNPAPGPDGRWATLDDDLGDLRLRLGSPAIDLGNNALLPADAFDLDGDLDTSEPLPLDLRGESRLADTTVDVGAYEYHVPTAAVHYIVDSLLDIVATDGVITLREAIEAANGGITTGDVPLGSYIETDTISFHPDLFTNGPTTITLGGTELIINDSLVIKGPGAEILAIDADHLSRILAVNGENTHAQISNLTLQKGSLGAYSLRDGGAILNTNAKLDLSHVIIADSIADVGGGLYNAYGQVNLTNALVVGNTTEIAGGGIYNHHGLITLTQSTVTGNVTSTYYGREGGIAQNEGNTILNNSIVALNTSSPSGQVNGHITNNHSLIDIDPIFVRPYSPGPDGQRNTPDDDLGDLRLTANSIAINLGDNELVTNPDGAPLATDLAGDARITHNRVDLGAYEFQGDIVTPHETPSAHVNTTDDTINPIDGLTSLREAILYGGILQQNPTFAPHLANATFLLRAGQLTLTQSMQINASPIESITINANNQSRVFAIIEGANIELTNLKITGGSLIGNGAGIYNEGNLTLNHTTVNDNTAHNPGGNFVSLGGGIANAGSLTLNHATISNNQAHEGGGIHNFDTLTTLHTVISNNTAVRGGGVNSSGVATLNHTQIASNKGGGLYNQGEATLNNSAVLANSSSQGPGIYNYNAPLILNNSTITANYSSNQYDSGAGIYMYSSYHTINNSIVALNLSPQALDIAGGSITYNNSLITTDPLFVRNPAPGPDGLWATPDDDLGDLRLRPESPAINIGDNALLPADEYDLDNNNDTTEPLPLDLRGDKRIHNVTVDAGAYEYHPSIHGDLNGDKSINAKDADLISFVLNTDNATPYYDLNLDGAITPNDGLYLIQDILNAYPADFNLDHQVDVTDLSTWATGFAAASLYSQGDSNFDGQIDVADLSTWATNFGKTSTPPTPVSALITSPPLTQSSNTTSNTFILDTTSDIPSANSADSLTQADRWNNITSLIKRKKPSQIWNLRGL